MTSSTAKRCAACRGEVPPLDRGEATRLLLRLGHGWHLADGRRLERTYTFGDFREALMFVNRIGDAADARDHHPEILLAWGLVRIAIWTRAIDALTESDFALASDIEELFAELSRVAGVDNVVS
jgi:4a-hydroxytetrahydrobiopterin dehydratase